MHCEPIRFPGGGGGFFCGRPPNRAMNVNIDLAPRLDLAAARRIAGETARWLEPHCERIEIAGSIRRGKNTVGDIDLVAIPKYTGTQDMFGGTTDQKNQCWEFIKNHTGRHLRILTGDSPDTTWISLRGRHCQLDIFFCTAATWATTLLQRTGSKEHNKWLAERAQRYDMHWAVNRGLFRLGKSGEQGMGDPLPCETEEAIYAHLGLRLIAPSDRELPWLRKIDSGL